MQQGAQHCVRHLDVRTCHGVVGCDYHRHRLKGSLPGLPLQGRRRRPAAAAELFDGVARRGGAGAGADGGGDRGEGVVGAGIGARPCASLPVWGAGMSWSDSPADAGMVAAWQCRA